MSSLGFVTGFCCKLHDARSDGRVLGSGDHRPSHRPPDYRPVYSAQSGAGALVPITEVRGLGLGVFKARARAPWGLGDYFSISISMIFFCARFPPREASHFPCTCTPGFLFLYLLALLCLVWGFFCARVSSSDCLGGRSGRAGGWMIEIEDRGQEKN